MTHPVTRDSDPTQPMMVNVAFGPKDDELYSATFMFENVDTDKYQITVINSLLLNGERLSYNHDAYGFTISCTKDPLDNCLMLAFMYVTASHKYQKTVGTLTKEEGRSVSKDDIQWEQVGSFWGPLTYLRVLRKRGVEMPCVDLINYVEATAKIIYPLRVTQWIEAAYIELRNGDGYDRVKKSYGELKDMVELIPEELSEVLQLACKH